MQREEPLEHRQAECEQQEPSHDDKCGCPLLGRCDHSRRASSSVLRTLSGNVVLITVPSKRPSSRTAPSRRTGSVTSSRSADVPGSIQSAICLTQPSSSPTSTSLP